MTRTRKALIVVLSVLCVVCLGLFTLSACKKKDEVKLDSVKITQAPDKTVYVQGEEFKPDGLKVEAKFTDETTVELTADDYKLTVPEMKTYEGEFESTKAVKVSYTYGEDTKTANQSITITNKVTKAEINTAPNKTAYFPGQFFDPTGLKIDADFEDKTSATVTITKTNATFEPAGAIPSGTKVVKVTYGGYTFDVAITELEGVWIEGETGLLNGKAIEQKTTTDGGKLGIDADLASAQTYAINYLIANAKADYALAQLTESLEEEELAELAATPSANYKDVNWAGVTVKGEQVTALYDAIVEWLEDNSNDVAKYLEKEGYSTEKGEDGKYKGEKVQKYVESEQYEADVTALRANADRYLGGNGKGDVISFVFNSNGEGNGSIAFRLASAYICLDNGNWSPKIMGDVQLNKLAEVYVNGVEYDIPDSAVLYGGMTPDGSNNGMLWVNWQEVELININFVEGRNSIEFKIKNHSIIAPAQTEYSWSCNIDSMLIGAATEGIKLTTFDNTKEIDIEAAATELNVAKVENSAILTVKGNYTAKLEGEDIKGYIADQLGVTVGSLAAKVVAENGKFTATLDITDLELEDYDIKVLGKAVVKEDGVTVNTETITVGTGHFKLNVDEEKNTVTLNVDNDYKVVVDKITLSYKNTDVTLNKVDDHVYLTVTGNTYEAKIDGYDVSKADDAAKVKALLEEKIQAATYLDVQCTGTPNYNTYFANKHVVTVNITDKTFKLELDITTLGVAVYGSHLYLPAAKEGDGNFVPSGDISATKVSIGYIDYTISFDKDSTWGCLNIKVEDNTPRPEYEVTSVELVEVDGKPAMIIKGNVTKNFAFTEDAELYLATVLNKDPWTTPNRTKEIAETTVFTAGEGDKGTFTVTWYLTKLTVGEVHWIHFTGAGVDLPSKAIVDGKGEITVGGVKYWLEPAAAESSPLIHADAVSEQ